MVAVLWRCRLRTRLISGVACGPTGVPGTVWPALKGRAAVCAGGRRPAREIATREPAARSGRSRGPPWPCRRPPAPRPGPAGHAVASNRVGLGARVLVLAMLPPSGTAPAPVPLSAHHTGAASLLISASVRQDRRLDRSSWSGPERNIAPADCSSAWHASAVKEISPLLS